MKFWHRTETKKVPQEFQCIKNSKKVINSSLTWHSCSLSLCHLSHFFHWVQWSGVLCECQGHPSISTISLAGSQRRSWSGMMETKTVLKSATGGHSHSVLQVWLQCQRESLSRTFVQKPFGSSASLHWDPVMISVIIVPCVLEYTVQCVFENTQLFTLSY